MVPFVAALVLFGLFLAAVGLGQVPGLPGVADYLASLRAPDDAGTSLGRSAPTRLTIASLGVRAATVEVGRAEDGSIATPTGDPVKEAGWYSLGPAPGEAGTAIIVGHVDTASRPAVFSRLADLRQGKRIEVRRADRRSVTFTVDSVERFSKASFPAERVFDAADRPRLVLITCGGAWVGGDVGYADNIIAFATRA